MRLVSLALLFLLASPLSAQKINKYWVEFSDKNNSPYCTCRPTEFLSARALARRARANIAVVENDLPPNPSYIKALTTNGLVLHGQSRWLNAVSVMADSASAENAKQLPFVKSVTYLGPHLKYRNPRNRPAKRRTTIADYPRVGTNAAQSDGYASQQNALLNTQPLHWAGHRGAGKWVVVMDGGFANVDTLPFFDSLALQRRLFVGPDFVERDEAVYETSFHGTSVLSVMAANLPGYFVGTAPDATYFLVKTEDTGGEFPIEEANWIAGAEWADSLGADLINASLGYTTFNDKLLNHNYLQLDGRTAIGSRGASIAATKGMIICNSAGNEGNEPWRYIGVPADAPGIVAVGSVDSEGRRSEFSSVGPSADGRIKPDLVAPGDQVVVAGNTGVNLGLSSGTSLAAPMLTGALATLWSAYPDQTAAEILDAVFATSNQANAPDNGRGYGLPNVTAAFFRLGDFVQGSQSAFAADAASRELKVLNFNLLYPEMPQVELRDWRGVRVAGIEVMAHPHLLDVLELRFAEPPARGPYQVVLTYATRTERMPVAIW